MPTRSSAELATEMDMGLEEDQQLVKNANFDDNLDDWTPGAGWAAGTNGDENVAAKSAGAATDLVQDIDATTGRDYLVVVKTLGRTAGTVLVDIGGTNGAAISTNTRTVQAITCGQTDSNLRIEADAAFDGDINSIVVYPGWSF